MFEFTREFILNDASEVKAVGGVLQVPRMINIEKNKVHSIHHAPHFPAVEESLALNVKDKNGTLIITIGQEGRVISLVSSRDAQNQKDYIFNGTPADWKRQFERQAAMEDVDRLIDVNVETVTGEGGAITDQTLVIKALDCYTRVLKVTLVTDKVEDGKVIGEDVKEWSRKAYWQNAANNTLDGPEWKGTLTPGTVGMGTVALLQNNNRLLTAANIFPYGFDRDERPIPHGEYDQYTIQYVSERRHQTAGVFGAIDHSLVTLVFFVEKKAKTDWVKELTTFCGEDITVCEVVKDPTKDANKIVGDQAAAPAEGTDTASTLEAKEEVVSTKKHTAKTNAGE